MDRRVLYSYQKEEISAEINELESVDIPRVSTFLKRFSSVKVVALQRRQHFRKIMKIPYFRHRIPRFGAKSCPRVRKIFKNIANVFLSSLSVLNLLPRGLKQ